MEKAFAMLLGISFAGIALFGFSAASAPPAGGVSGTHVGCVADMFQELQGGSACPVTESPFALLASHLGSLKGFVGSVGMELLALLALVAYALFLWLGAVLPPSTPSFFAHAGIPMTPRAALKRIRWIARHETSPTDAV